jgi:anthranilate phosphoribosyltransferase
MLDNLIQQLGKLRPLSAGQVAEAVAALTDEAVDAGIKAAFLTALANKGETTEEIAAFAGELREKSLRPPLDAETRQREILDVCGTGGDRLNTFNISTTVALIAAAAGVTVAKHGNRAITSQSGSADVLEALGVPIDLGPEEAAVSLRERNFAFFFAQRYHPAFRHIGPARKLCADRGQRTIFNFLGPLLNPARPTAQLVGVSRPDLCEPMARVLQSLGARRAMVVCGKVPANAPERHPDGSVSESGRKFHFLDELSTLGESEVAEFYQEHALARSTLSPSLFPVRPATLADLAGGDRETNARIILALLEGRERGPKRDAVLLNAGAALFVAGRVRSQIEGFEMASGVIDSGKAMEKLSELRR